MIDTEVAIAAGCVVYLRLTEISRLCSFTVWFILLYDLPIHCMVYFVYFGKNIYNYYYCLFNRWIGLRFH